MPKFMSQFSYSEASVKGMVRKPQDRRAAAEKVFGYPVSRWLEEPTFWQDVLLHPDDREWCVHYCTVASGDCRNHAFIYRAVTASRDILWIKDFLGCDGDTISMTAATQPSPIRLTRPRSPVRRISSSCPL